MTLHGGPTSAAEARLDPLVQLWTSRGFAVADLDYRGSWGYGRAYRDALHGRWGDADVTDSAALVRHLAAAGRADPSRAVIRGGSAGGFTVLLALALTDAFAAGVDYFGVADLHTIVTDSHEFESRYCDRLIGPLRRRRIATSSGRRRRICTGCAGPCSCARASTTRWCRRAQSQAVIDAVAANGVPYAYVTFPGESHGFVRAETLRRAREAELSFLSQVLGFELPAEEGRRAWRWPASTAVAARLPDSRLTQRGSRPHSCKDATSPGAVVSASTCEGPNQAASAASSPAASRPATTTAS